MDGWYIWKTLKCIFNYTFRKTKGFYYYYMFCGSTIYIYMNGSGIYAKGKQCDKIFDAEMPFGS